MKVKFRVPAFIEMTVDVDCDSINDAFGTILEGEFDVINTEVLEWDYSEIEGLDEVKN
jgi:hypothetical protein